MRLRKRDLLFTVALGLAAVPAYVGLSVLSRALGQCFPDSEDVFQDIDEGYGLCLRGQEYERNED